MRKEIDINKIEEQLSPEDIKQLFFSSYFFMRGIKTIDASQFKQWTEIVKSTLPDHIRPEMFDEWLQEAEEAVNYIERSSQNE